MRLLMLVVRERDDEAARASTPVVIDDPGAGLSAEEREELDRAIREGRPLSLDSEGRLHPAR